MWLKFPQLGLLYSARRGMLWDTSVLPIFIDTHWDLDVVGIPAVGFDVVEIPFDVVEFPDLMWLKFPQLSCTPHVVEKCGMRQTGKILYSARPAVKNSTPHAEYRISNCGTCGVQIFFSRGMHQAAHPTMFQIQKSSHSRG